MRILSILLLLLAPWPCFSQLLVAPAVGAPPPRLAYSGTEAVADVNQAELAARVQAWAHRHSGAAQPAAFSADQVIVRGAEDMVYPKDGAVLHQPLHYTLTLSVQGSGYHYRLTDFVLETGGPAHALLPIEPLLAQVPATDKERQASYLFRTAFEEATAQLLGGLQYDLAQPLSADPTSESSQSPKSY